MLTLRWLGEDRLYKAMIRVESAAEKGAEAFVNEAIEWLANDVRKHWSLRSPSSKGSSPAVVTGNLDSSIDKSIGQGRDTGGRFASTDNVKVKFMYIDTSKGDDPMGRGNYARALEEGLDRPFLAPALERLKGEGEWLARRYIVIK